MGPLFGPSLVVLLAIGLVQTAAAQDRTPGQPPSPSAASLPPSTSTTLTGKERLGGKWMDEQRIDNCKVPADKRGLKLRPSTCAHVPMG